MRDKCCPIMSDGSSIKYCKEIDCTMWSKVANNCLIVAALETYIQRGIPIQMFDPAPPDFEHTQDLFKTYNSLEEDDSVDLA